jgi:Transposase DDE domain group 1
MRQKARANSNVRATLLRTRRDNDFTLGVESQRHRLADSRFPPRHFLITECHGPASDAFAFYNDGGESKNCIEELKNGFRGDRLSCHCFLINAFRLFLHAAAYNLANFFRLQLPLP